MDEHPYLSGESALAEVLGRVPLLPHIIEDAVHSTFTIGKFDENVRKDLAPDWFRAVTRAALTKIGLTTADEKSSGTRNSLQIIIDPERDVVLRVLKKPRGLRTPQPRSSLRRSEYRQDSLFDQDVLPTRIALVWTWDLSSDGHVVQHLLLPKAQGEQDRFAGHHWRIPVPDVLAGLEVVHQQEDIGNVDDFDDLYTALDEDIADNDPDPA